LSSIVVDKMVWILSNKKEKKKKVGASKKCQECVNAT
jgi:hypothetical protein